MKADDRTPLVPLAAPAEDVPLAMLQRLRLIDFLLAEYGTVNRRAITDYFGLSKPQASLDLRHYHALAPDNLVYDMRAKLYRRTPRFRRLWR